MKAVIDIKNVGNVFMINEKTGKKIPLFMSELSIEKDEIEYNQEITKDREPKIVTHLSSEPYTVTFENMYVDWVTFYEALFGIQFRWYQKIYLRLLCHLSYFFKTGKWVRRAKYNG